MSSDRFSERGKDEEANALGDRVSPTSCAPYKGKMFSEFRLYIRYCGETRESSKRFYAWNCPKRPAAACATVQRGAHLAAPFFRRGRPRQLTWRERPREY